MLIAIVHNWVICQVYCSQTIKVDLLQKWQRIRSGPVWFQILLFFSGSGSDPNPVLLEDADQDLNLALPF